MSNASHGLSRHKHYDRWNSMVQKCYSPKNKSFKNYGARGIGIDFVWSPTNAIGVQNFILWLQGELDKKPNLKNKMFVVHRKNVNGNFGPNNCLVGSRILAKQNRRSQILDLETVVAMRRFKRENPSISLEQIRLKFGEKFSINTISRGLRGEHWANANCIEAPIPKFNHEQYPT